MHKYLLLVFFALSLNDITNSLNFSGNCELIEEQTLPAYTSWPFSIKCDSLREKWKNDHRRSPSDIEKCQIYHLETGGRILSEEGLFEIPTITGSKSYAAELVINESICIAKNVTVNFKDIPQETCQQGEDRAFTATTVRHRMGVFGSSLLLRCDPPEGTPELIPSGISAAERSKFTTHWKYNCGTRDDLNIEPLGSAYRSSGSNQPDINTTNPDKLQLYGIDFYDAGNFSCSVSYEGRKLQVAHRAVCIQQTKHFTKPTMTCRMKQKVPQGSSVTLDCTAQVVLGTIYPGDLLIEWKKDGKLLCRNEVYNITKDGLNRLKCFAHGDNSSIQCVKDANPDSVRIQEGRRLVDSGLIISDIAADDYGTYEMILTYQKTHVTSSTVELTEDNTPLLHKLIIIFSTIIGVLVFIAITAFITNHFKIYIQIAYKRSSLWKHDKDDKNYVVYLSYFYERKLDDKVKQNTEKVVQCIENTLDSMNYNYYDEQQEPDCAFVVERIANMVENCHRMVIVLTTEYLNNRWCRHDAELGFHALLESRMGLIFILTPGVKKKLKKLAAKDKAWERVLIAVRTNKTINWKEKMSDKEFSYHIEYTLPKLNRTKNNAEYNRSESRTTQTTMLSPDEEPICKTASPIVYSVA